MTFAKADARAWFAGIALLAALLACSAATTPLPAPRATPSATPLQPLDPSDAPTRRPPDTLPDLEEIQGQVSTVRGLYPAGPLDRQLIAPEELGQRVEEDFLDEYTAEQAADDVRVLSLFGLVEPGFDLLDFHLDFYEEQVAGYYDTEIERMYVVGSQWGGAERLTYAHEYVHALQDQTYDLEGALGYNDEACGAVLAPTEPPRGDFSTPPPAYIRQDFLFPYDQGLQFVRALFRQGGWAAVDAAYLDPPTTTEQILHPELKSA